MYLGFALLVVITLSTVSFSVLNWHCLSRRFAYTTKVSNSSFPLRRSSCFTVSFAPRSRRSRLGNHLFQYAAVWYVAWLTGRKPNFQMLLKRSKLEAVFDLVTEPSVNSKRCPVIRFIHRPLYGYDDRVKHLKNVNENISIHLDGTFCSWRYTQPVEDQLRKRLQFHRNLTTFAEQFLYDNLPRKWNAYTFIRVGVHVRRGDFLDKPQRRNGFIVASKEYLERAMTYYIERYSPVQFIVASDDIDWCRKNIELSSLNQENINITFSIAHSAEQDLALLASCNCSIMTTGTFSWWASWLTHGSTVYYENFSRPRSSLWKRSKAADFFPPSWIAKY